MQNQSLTRPVERADSSPRLYSVPDACAALGGMGRSWLYEQIKAGRIRAVKLGARTLVPAGEIDRLIAEAEAVGVAE